MGLSMHGVLVTPLSQFPNDKGSLLHVIKKSSQGFSEFGETYVSTLNKGTLKGWKRHREMICNLVVPVGAVEFTLRDERQDSPTNGLTESITLSRKDNYVRLTIPPQIWFSFEGIEEPENLVINVASIEHSDEEAEIKPIE